MERTIIGTMSSKIKGIIALASIGVATALSAPMDAHAAQVYAGFMSPEGVISGPAFFTATRISVGAYQIYAPQSKFTAGFPVMNITPFGINGHYVVPILESELCESGKCQFDIQLLDLITGDPEDNGFVFSVITD